MLGDSVQVEEWACVKETKMCCAEKGLNGRAEEGLMHVFDPVMDVSNGVNAVR